MTGKTIVVGITGASGAAYARKLLELLENDSRVGRVHLVVSEAGQRLVAMELGLVASDLRQLPQLLVGSAKKIDLLPNKDIGASIASGTYPVDGMVVIPCTTGALGAIAAGTSDDLIARAGDVCLKENRRLILCVRETPLGRIHLENMLRVQAAGAVIMPAVPAFYFGPKTIDDLVTQFVCRVLEHLGLPQEGQYRWMGAGARKKEE
ncbi:MAG TPA: UbiX family flavin prenyltransferase [Candidatus Dormibacteraeota bacterium]|nr:UbiX family flavin prenyltransferase [Candidatus Dormibacteraeota bacterium]